jgi:ribosomal protein L19E
MRDVDKKEYNTLHNMMKGGFIQEAYELWKNGGLLRW